MTRVDKPFDVVIPKGPTKDGRGLLVTRLRPEGETESRLYVVPDGTPFVGGGEMIELRPREGKPGYDVEVLYKHGEPPGSGPPKVTSDAYREGWDVVFGRRAAGGEEPN